MYLYDTFEPGSVIGTRSLTLAPELVGRWQTLFPEDRDGDTMPAGMTAVVLIRVYSDLLQPRPPGNIHGAQVFAVTRLPRLGDTIETTLTCRSKEMRGERRWVRIGVEARATDGAPLFTGLMTTLWAK